MPLGEGQDKYHASSLRYKAVPSSYLASRGSEATKSKRYRALFRIGLQ